MARSNDHSRFEAYLDRLAGVLGHADRREPLRAYLTGLLLDGDRKSVEPMAARIDPRHVQARHQSMHHFVAKAAWDEQALLEVARDYALGALERHAPVSAWVIDDTGIPKKGRHSVGVGRQYCGVLGKTDNCQVIVSLSMANATMSIPCAWRLYLPRDWAEDPALRRAGGVPDEVRFHTKWQIALQQIDKQLADDLPRAPVVADAGYGIVTEFRDGLRQRGLSYAVGVTREVSVWAPGTEPLPVPPYQGRGRPPARRLRDADHQPVSLEELAKSLPAKAFKDISWREGTKGRMTSRFAAVRVRTAHGDRLRDVEWLVIEWPAHRPEPLKYFLSSVPEHVALDDLIRLIKIRWRIERDYEELKGELGLDHYEGRSWRGLHHHGALCIAAYCYLAAERARLSPPESLAFLRAPAVPKGFRPRGSASKTRAA
jgi:SRSO17 transposase